tara:strand:+ start:487 stop:5754 length:5268 start_codon:yes stop_codon:yes gene_type:complete
MANTAKQMEVFGYTPKGLDQEVKKYKPEPSKGLSYGELIVDNILGLDNEYESFGEKLGKAVNEDEIKFLKDAAVGIYEGAKEFVQAPVETTKQVVNEIKNSVVSLGSEDLDTRLQRMFNVSYKQATNDQVNQAREAVLGDAFTALELIPAAAGTTTAIKMGVGAVPSGVKADVIGQTKAIFSGDKEFLKGTPTEKASTAGVGANVPGMFPKSIPEDLEDIDFDPDRIKGNIDELFKLVDIKKKYGLSDTDDISDVIIPPSVTEAFTPVYFDISNKKLNLNNVDVNFYRPIQIDRENPFLDIDEGAIEEAANAITIGLREFSDQHSTFPAPILRDPNVTRENVPTFTDQQVNDLARGEMGPDVPNQITQTTLVDAVTDDYFDQVQAELLSSIDKKVKEKIPLLPIDQLARLVGLSNADTLLPQRSLDSLEKLGAEDLLDNELKNFIRDFGILEYHYISDPRDYRRQNKNPSRENPFLDDDPDFNLVDETSFTADLTPRTSRVDGLTGRVIFKTDPGKTINGQTKYKFESVFGRSMEDGNHPLFNINNNNSYIINGIKESLKDYFKTLDLNIETNKGDTLGEISKLLTSEYITQRSVSRIDPGNVATELENVGKVALLELSKSVGNKPMKGARILDALEKDPRISNKNIPEYFKSSEFKGKTFNPSEFEDLADRYYKDSPLVSYPPDFGSVSFDVIQRQDLNYNPDSGKFAGGKVVDTYQRQIMAEAGPTNRVPAFTPKERQHMDQKDLAHVRYTEIEPIDVTDESAIRETYPALENRDLDSDFAKGLEEFEDIIGDENYFLVDEIQSDLMKGFRKFIPIPFTKEIVRNALTKRHITDKEFQERVDSGFTQPGETNQSFMERFSSVNFEPYEDEIFEKITELLDIYHNKGGSSLAVGKDAELNKVQANFVDSIVEKERLRAPTARNTKYFLEFKVKLNNLLNQATSARLYDKSQIGEGGLKGASYQAIINRKSFDTPESYQKPPIKDRKEAVQLAIQRLIFDAQKRGVNKIVIPNFDRIASNQRYEGEQLFYALQNKSFNPKTREVKPNDALYDTYVTSLDKVLPEFEKAYGLKVYRDVTLPYVKDGISDFSKRSDVPLRKDKEFLRGDPIRFSDKGIVIDISDMKEKFDLDKPAFAEGGDTVRPEPKPETRPFPDVKPKTRPDSDKYRGRTYDIYSVEIDGRETNVIEFKDGKRMSVPQIRQMFEEHKSASESIPGKQTSQEISKFLEDNNPTYDEFVRHFTAKRLNKGGEVGEQMQMAFMNEGGLTDDGMNTDPVSGNDIPSGSMAEEVRDDIPAQLSEGEYVVPADVVRYYGVKFFEDLRDRAKRGLAEMEANGRIGGEPVPEGGPINNEELSPEEMQAIQEMMGMSQGGAIGKLNQQQQILQEPANKAVGNPQMMYGGGQVRGYQNSSLVTQAQSNLLGGQSQSQVEQQMLSAAGNKPYIGQPLGFSLFGNSNTGVKQDQSQTSAFTPMVLYNKAGQSRSVSSEEEKAKAIADGYTMTLEQYNMYRSQSGGSGGSGPTITTGDEDKESKPWGQDVNWNNVDDIKQFVAQAERGNLSGSGRFLRGAGFAIAGLPGAMLAGAFQIGKGLNSIYDMEAAKIIAEAKGHTELATEIQEGIDTYLETAGDISNYFYKPKSKAVISRVNRYLKGQGIDSIEDVQKAYSTTGTKIDTVKGKDGSTVNVYKAGKDTIKPVIRPSSSGTTSSTVVPSGGPGTFQVTDNTPSANTFEGNKVDPTIGGRNKGGLMTKGKKKKKK